MQDGLNFRHRPPLPEIEVLQQDGAIELLEINGLRFFWPSEYGHKGLKGIYQEVFAPARCNPHAYEVGRIFVRPGDWVVDAGACEGFFTFHALQKGARVLVVEPVQQLVDALSRTFEKEIQDGRLLLLRGALGEMTGTLILNSKKSEIYMSHIDADGTETVPVYTLDQILHDGLIPKVDFLKMDVEGAEIQAIRGATRTLKEHMPRLSIAVYHEFANAITLRQLTLDVQPNYDVSWRGLYFNQDYTPPRPYMLHAIGK
jgi:FkbM family methyltransferase